jgi:HEAT repeat protein
VPETSRLVAGGILLLAGLSLLGCIVSTNFTDPSPEKAVPLLLQILKDPDPSQRQTAAQSLGKIGRKEALPALIEALNDPAPGVRGQAAWAVGMIGNDSASARRSLIPLLFDADAGVRESASPALGRTGEAGTARQTLEQRLLGQDTSSDTKRLAAAALGGMAIVGSSAIVSPLLHDQDPIVRRWAVAAVADIADQDAATSLAGVLKADPSPGVRIEAAFHLGKLGNPTAREALTRALTDLDEHVRLLAKSGLQ